MKGIGHRFVCILQNRIVAVCRRGRSRQRIGILDLPLPDPPPLAPRGSKRTGASRGMPRV